MDEQAMQQFRAEVRARKNLPTIPTVLVPIAFSFDAKHTPGKPFVMDAAADVSPVLRSPIFSRFAFASDNTTQYADAMLRSTFPKADGVFWHNFSPPVLILQFQKPNQDWKDADVAFQNAK